MIFWIIITVMMLVAVAMLMPSILRTPRNIGVSRKDLNVSIYQQRKTELEEEKMNGPMSDDQYEQALVELDKTFLNDLSGVESEHYTNQLSVKGRGLTLASIIILVPLLTIPLYMYYGSVDHVNPQDQVKEILNETRPAQTSMLQAIDSLVRNLKENPNNVAGWKLLARSYSSLNRLEDAIAAYQKAYQLNDKDIALMLDYAELLMTVKGNDPEGIPEELVNHALSLDPEFEKTLWLAGVVRFHYQDYEGTLKYWNKLLGMQQPGSETEKFVQNNIQKVLVKASGTVTDSDSMQTGVNESAQDGVGQPVSISVNVSLDQKFRDKIADSDIVFIYAKAASGPKMPLAVERKRVSNLPVTVTLDDSMAMTPMAKLSRFKQVVISAHVSRIGIANKQSGDLFGTSGLLDLSNTNKISITINQVVP